MSTKLWDHSVKTWLTKLLNPMLIIIAGVLHTFLAKQVRDTMYVSKSQHAVRGGTFLGAKWRRDVRVVSTKKMKEKDAWEG